MVMPPATLLHERHTHLVAWNLDRLASTLSTNQSATPASPFPSHEDRDGSPRHLEHGFANESPGFLELRNQA